MSPLSKRKSEAPAAATAMPSWHPNFRNFERLPDTKVVRTAFFVNGVAAVIAAIALLWVCYQQYQLHDLNRQIGVWQQQIDRDRPGSQRTVALYKKFQVEQSRVNEVETFLQSRPVISALLLRLGATLPKPMALDLFDLRSDGVVLRATVQGSPDEASGRASTYLTQLRDDPALADYFDDMSLTNLSRNAQTGRLDIELFLRLHQTAKKGAAKK
jgi:hypothetical protein